MTVVMRWLTVAWKTLENAFNCPLGVTAAPPRPVLASPGPFSFDHTWKQTNTANTSTCIRPNLPFRSHQIEGWRVEMALQFAQTHCCAKPTQNIRQFECFYYFLLCKPQRNVYHKLHISWLTALPAWRLLKCLLFVCCCSVLLAYIRGSPRETTL